MLISVMTVAYLPICFKIAQIIIKRNCDRVVDEFQSLVIDNQNKNIDFDKIIRLNLFEDIAYSRESERREVQLYNLIINSDIDFSNSSFISPTIQKSHSPNKLQKIQHLKQDNIVVRNKQQSQIQQTLQIEQFNDDARMSIIKERIKRILREQFKKLLKEKKRNKQSGFYELLIFFVFLIEVAQSYRIYWLQQLELSVSKNMSVKQMQMFLSVHSIFLKKRSVMRKLMGRSNPFDCSFLEVIVFEKRLEQSYVLLDLTIKVKLEILNVMKQKEIKVQDLIQKIEVMQQLKKDLKMHLNSLCYMNDDSLDLLNIQALFLENLAFCEKDINLMQVNKFKKKYQTKLRHKYLNNIQDDEIVSSTLNNDRFDEKTCVIFANYKDQRTLIINSVSQNFQDIFYFTTNNDIRGHNIESIIPFAFQPIHSQYIESYLDEEISCSAKQDQLNGQQLIEEDKNILLGEENLDLDKKNDAQKIREKLKTSLTTQNQCEWQGCRMNQQIIFAQINHLFILPVRIDLRINQYQDEKTFGLTAKIKHINCQFEYVLYEEQNLNVIGLTDKLHYTFFPNKESLSKISIKQVFPFLVGTQEIIYNQDKQEKNEFHVSLTEQMQSILQEQKKNQQKKQKINFIIIQGIDQKSSTMVSTASSQVSNKKSSVVVKSMKQLKSMYVQKDLSCYTFTFVQLSLHKVNYRGIEDISYIEIQKMRQLNPYEQAPYILSQLKNHKKKEIYEKYFQTNQDLEKIIIELEQRAILCSQPTHNNQVSSSLQAISALNNFLVPQNSSNNQISVQGSSLINNLLPQNQNTQILAQQKGLMAEDNQNIEAVKIKSGNIILDQDVISEQEEDEHSVQGLEGSLDKKNNKKNANKQEKNYYARNKQNSLEINNNFALYQNQSDQNFIHSFQEIQQEDHAANIDNQYLINNLTGVNDHNKNINYQNQSSLNEKSINNINNEISSMNYNQNTFYNNHMYNEIDEIKIQQSSNQLNKLNTTTNNNDEVSRIGLLSKPQKQQTLQYNQSQSIQQLLSPVCSEKTLNFAFCSPTSNQALNNNDKNQPTATSLSCQELKFFSPRATQQSISNLIEPNQEKKINNQKNIAAECLLSPQSLQGQSQRPDQQDLKFSSKIEKLSTKDHLKTKDSQAAKADQFNIQVYNQNYISQLAPRGSKNTDYSKENTKFQHREDQFSTSTPFGYNQQTNLKEDKVTKKLKVQEIQYDIASTNSKDSSSASAKRQLQQIMADRSLLQIIKVINIVGILCFSIMICLTWVQYVQTVNNINASYLDYQVFNWPTQYQSYLSSIVKYQNINYMVKFSTDLKFANLTQKSLFRNQTRSSLNYTKTNIINLIAQMERANTERKIFQLLRSTYFTYYIGQYYDPNQLINTSSIPSKLVYIPYNTSLQYGVVLSFSNIFRSFSSTGNGTSGNSSTNANSRAEYYMISNEQQELKSLKDIQNQMVAQQQNEQQGISDQLTVLMVLIITINGLCVSIILPLYYYIQKERDVIISLFATFSTYKIDSLIKQIQRSYYNQAQISMHSNKNSQSMKQTIASLQSLSKEKDIRKQNISSITKLPRFNIKIAIIVFFIYLLLICYPIIIKIVTQDYLAKTTLDLQTMKKVYELRSYLLENIAMNFNVIVMKINPSLKPMSPNIYYDYLNSLNQQQQQINTDIQWIVSSQYQNSRYNQNLYDSFFFSAFKNNLCDVFNQYPQFNTNSTKLNTTVCDSTNQGFLQQGFEVAYKQTLYLFPDLYRMYTIPDNKTSVAQISQFLSGFNIIDYIIYTEFLDECIVSLNQFILTQNNDFYNQIILFQIILISFQIVLMALVFFIGWVSFSNYLNYTLHQTKNYLQILDINTLIENSYILTYIKKNSTI